MQGLFRQGKSLKQAKESLIPRSIIQKNLNPYLFFISEDKKKHVDLDRYEFLVYRLLNNALDSGDIFIQNSNEFRRFEDDLISDLRWEDQESILKEIGSPTLLNPIKETLAEFNKIIEEKFKRINQRITDGSNKDIKVKGAKNKDKRRWTLTYPEEEESINSQFYNQVPGIGIADLLWFVGRETNFLKSFTHALDRYVKHESDPREILACIVAMGTNMGLYKMADVSGLSHSSLMTTSRNFIRLETLRSANDAISNAIAALPVFHLFDIKEALHSSSDGQRMETQINTINARYSLKYFGLKKGISSYTLVVNHVPTNSKIIGSHQYEGHYVFDILHNNTSNIKPEKHSTDTHGTNQVNFWILHAFGYRFAPRYRDLHKKMDTLVSFRHPSKYEGLLIKPARKVNEALIEKEWPNIQRIMASLAQKDTTQATIIRKLSSYHRQNQTKKALWELDSICRTIYILDFIDDVELRQSVQKALNRGEAYHRLRRAVAFVNAGKFRVKTETEQQIWNECSRLITNAIIYYNMVLLSRVYEQKLIEKDEAAIEAIKSMSPVAWQHVNLFGIIEFNQELSKVDIDAIVRNLINRGNFSGPLSEDYQWFFG